MCHMRKNDKTIFLNPKSFGFLSNPTPLPKLTPTDYNSSPYDLLHTSKDLSSLGPLHIGAVPLSPPRSTNSPNSGFGEPAPLLGPLPRVPSLSQDRTQSRLRDRRSSSRDPWFRLPPVPLCTPPRGRCAPTRTLPARDAESPAMT